MENIRVKRVLEVESVTKVLDDYDKLFMPTLKERVGNLNTYAKKLIENGFFYTYNYEEKVIAFLAFYANDFETKTGYLSQIAVNSDFNSKGIASEMLGFFEKSCVDLGMDKMKLEVQNNNNKAIKLYKKNGFYFTEKISDSSTYMLKTID